ncbi:MAG: ATP-binding protein, partial [Acidimicrobiales bacterium]
MIVTTHPAAPTARRAGAPTPTPTPRVGSAGRLPRPGSSFVGRARELADLVGLLGHRRLVTLVGPAGIGKTRLALEVATQAADRYPGGA